MSQYAKDIFVCISSVFKITLGKSKERMFSLSQIYNKVLIIEKIFDHGYIV